MCLLAGEAIDPKTILSTPCDVLVPAAIGNVIDAATAELIDAKYVVEAANGPTTPEGDAVLRKRGITVLPDIYTNGGMCRHLLVHPGTPGCMHGCTCVHLYAWSALVSALQGVLQTTNVASCRSSGPAGLLTAHCICIWLI